MAVTSGWSFTKACQDHGEGTLAPKSIRNEVFTLVNLFAWATERDLLLENPSHLPRGRHRFALPLFIRPMGSNKRPLWW